MVHTAYCDDCGGIVTVTGNTCPFGHPRSSLTQMAHCIGCGSPVKIINGACEHGHPLSALRALPPPKHEVSPSVPPCVPSAAPFTPRNLRPALTVLKRVTLNMYSWPVTFAVMGSSIDAIRRLGTIAYVDLALSLPLYIAIHLYTWDALAFGPLFWRITICLQVVWQLAYMFVLGPLFLDIRPGLNAVAGTALLLPMYIAAFRYAFRRWPERKAKGLAHAVPSAESPLVGAAIVADFSSRKSSVRTNVMSMVGSLIGTALIVGVTMIPPLLAQHPEYDLANFASDREIYTPSVPVASQAERTFVPAGLTCAEFLELRKLFDDGDFDTLDRRLAAIQAEFEKDTSADRKVADVYDIFCRSDDGEQLDKWVEHSSEQPWPYAARGSWRVLRAWDERGTSYANQTSNPQFRRMEWWFKEAAEDIDSALAVNPRILECYVNRIRMDQASGEREEEPIEAFRDGQKVLPDSYVLHAIMVQALLPRWGGSYPQMEKFAREAIAKYPDNPRFKRLAGFILSDQADLLFAGKRHAQAIEVYGKAMEYGETTYLFETRGQLYLMLNKPELALKDIERALELSPTSRDALVACIELHYTEKDQKKAAEYITIARRLHPKDPGVLEWVGFAQAEGFLAPLPVED